MKGLLTLVAGVAARHMRPGHGVPLSLVRSAAAVAILLPTSLAHAKSRQWIVCRAVRITTAGADLGVNCGAEKTIRGELDWSKPLDPEAAADVDVDIYSDEDWPASNISLGKAKAKIPPGERTGTSTFEFKVKCDPQVDKVCKFHGPDGEDDDTGTTHDVFVKVDPQGCVSPNVIFTCFKPNGGMGMADPGGIPGGSYAANVTWDDNIVPCSMMDLRMTYDPAAFGIPAILSLPPFVAGFDNIVINTSTPGQILIHAAANPARFSNGQLVHMIFPVLHGAPLGTHYLQYDHVASLLRGPAHEPLDVAMPRLRMTVRPTDSNAPSILPAMLNVSHLGVSGLPGCIADDNLGVPGWVGASLHYHDINDGQYHTILTGDPTFRSPYDLVAGDGSFDIALRMADGDYRLVAWDYGGLSSQYDFHFTNPTNVELDLTPGMALHEAKPNPFQSSTLVSYSLVDAGPVRLWVYGVAGRLVRTLVSGTKSTGRHVVEWDGRDDAGLRVPAGVYYLRLEGNGVRTTRPVTLVD